MATRRAIRGVLGNFLGTYTSRYSDYDGYWLFGFIVADLVELRIDLMGLPVTEENHPHGVAVRSAVGKFEDQMRKAGLIRSQVREAWLTVRKLPGAVDDGTRKPCTGYNLGFSAAAVMDDGRRYEREQIVFVAPHNPEVELRSARAS